MKRLAAIVILMMSSMAVGRDIKHAPTVAQCQADQRLWLAKLEDGAIDETYSTVAKWIPEMLNCGDVDRKNEIRYYDVVEKAYAELLMRTTNFIILHGRWEQFVAEDEAGKR